MLGARVRHCILHKCVARFVSVSGVSYFTVACSVNLIVNVHETTRVEPQDRPLILSRDEAFETEIPVCLDMAISMRQNQTSTFTQSSLL